MAASATARARSRSRGTRRISDQPLRLVLRSRCDARRGGAPIPTRQDAGHGRRRRRRPARRASALRGQQRGHALGAHASHEAAEGRGRGHPRQERLGRVGIEPLVEQRPEGRDRDRRPARRSGGRGGPWPRAAAARAAPTPRGTARRSGRRARAPRGWDRSGRGGGPTPWAVGIASRADPATKYGRAVTGNHDRNSPSRMAFDPTCWAMSAAAVSGATRWTRDSLTQGASEARSLP